MKNTILLALLLIAFTVPAFAQQQKTAPDAPVTVSGEAQKQFAEAVAQAERARADADAANARLEAAQARTNVVIFRAMAELKLSPREYAAVLTKEGQLQFVKIPPPEEKNK